MFNILTQISKEQQMRFSKLLKGVVIALPLIVATACSSTSNDNDGSGNGYNNGNGSGLLTGSEAQQVQQLQRINTVYFDFDKYNIDSEYSKILDTHAEFLRAHPSFAISVEGHADERGTPEYNIALGERRAAAVKAYLQGRGVSDSQITIKSFGKEKPAVLGHDAAAYAKNRRAVIVY